MKKTSSTTAVKRNRASTVRVEFEHPSAHTVYIAGSFNNWHPAVTEMIPFSGGHWGKELTLPPGIYEYRFVVDGEWMADPKAVESVPNPFGGLNSVLRA